MKNITILLPVYVLGELEQNMLSSAIESVEPFADDVKVTVIHPTSIKSTIKKFNFGNKVEVKLLENKTNNTNFQAQINLGIQDADTEWFSILEIDDVYKPTWAKLGKHYIETYKEVDVFLPIVEDLNPKGEFAGFTNESLWALGFTNSQGFLDNEILQKFQNYQTSGGLFKTKTIIDNGSFKDNIKLTFVYEFLLRLTNNAVSIMGIPKIGYRHVNFRDNSLFWLHKNDEQWKLEENEANFWVETAKKEYHYKNKRDIEYVKS